jgi:predicted DNA-binding transcriptional regulator AlpA
MPQKQMADTEAQTLWRFRDLKAKGVVTDRATLRRWMKSLDDPFPSPIVLSANSIAWRASEVREWLDNRPRGPAPQPRHQAAERRAQLGSGSLPDSSIPPRRRDEKNGDAAAETARAGEARERA